MHRRAHRARVERGDFDPIDAPDAGQWIRAIRWRSKLSQRQLAELSGVPRSTIARTEAGKGSVSFETMMRLVAATGCVLSIRDEGGQALDVDPEREDRVNRAGRRFPAHLVSGLTPGYFDWEYEHSFWWGWHCIAWAFTDDWVPEHTYWMRQVPPVRRPEEPGQPDV